MAGETFKPNPDLERLSFAQRNLEQLRENPYPGRFISMGITQEGTHVVQVYAIMGRGEGSRNRIFLPEGANIKTAVFDESKEKGDPTLTLYTVMTSVNGIHIVTNGRQTDQLIEAAAHGSDLAGAMRQFQHEPDHPIYTPRISAAYDEGNNDQPFVFSIASMKGGKPGDNHIATYFLPKEQGTGRTVHTYNTNGNPPPHFNKAPYVLPLRGSIDDITDTYWGALDQENKVSLAVRSFNRQTGEIDTRIVNKHIPQES